MKKELEIEPKIESEKIKKFIKHEVKSLKKEGIVLGLSGGLDSSTVVYLAGEVLGKERIFALILPERDSDPVNIKNARRVAKILDLNYKEIDLTPILEKIGVYKLSIEKIPQNRNLIESFIKKQKISLFAQGFSSFYEKVELAGPIKKIFSKLRNETAALTALKTRLRMVFLYYFAKLKNYLVLGTSDKTEWQIGYYDGDAIVDAQPLLHLYKTQIRKLAEFLGVPREIIEKPSSGDIFGRGVANEIVIGLPYEKLDLILYFLEKGEPIEKISLKTGIEKEKIKAISKLISLEKIRKSLPSSLNTL